MRIGDVARMLGTDAPTIRYYEEVGILPGPARQANRYRVYKDEDVRRIELVLALRRLDVPVDEIRALARTCIDHRCATGTQQLLAVIDRRWADVHRQIDALQSLAGRLTELRRRLTGEEMTTMTTETSRPLDRKEVSHTSICDCGCSGSGCTCGCACCGSIPHAEHLTAVEVLAQLPQTACDCGCCGPASSPDSAGSPSPAR